MAPIKQRKRTGSFGKGRREDQIVNDEQQINDIHMKIVRYCIGITGLLLVWFVVAVIVGFCISSLFPPPGGQFAVGIGLDWRNVPGAILGLLAGIQSFRASIRERPQK
jgi:hypothetical protein